MNIVNNVNIARRTLRLFHDFTDTAQEKSSHFSENLLLKTTSLFHIIQSIKFVGMKQVRQFRYGRKTLHPFVVPS